MSCNFTLSEARFLDPPRLHEPLITHVLLGEGGPLAGQQPLDRLAIGAVGNGINGDLGHKPAVNFKITASL